jgi:hypothetical protein
VVLIHGFPFSGRAWERQERALIAGQRLRRDRRRRPRPVLDLCRGGQRSPRPVLQLTEIRRERIDHWGEVTMAIPPTPGPWPGSMQRTSATARCASSAPGTGTEAVARHHAAACRQGALGICRTRGIWAGRTSTESSVRQFCQPSRGGNHGRPSRRSSLVAGWGRAKVAGGPVVPAVRARPQPGGVGPRMRDRGKATPFAACRCRRQLGRFPGSRG